METIKFDSFECSSLSTFAIKNLIQSIRHYSPFIFLLQMFTLLQNFEVREIHT